MSKPKRTEFRPARECMDRLPKAQRKIIEADARAMADVLVRRTEAADFDAFDRIMARETEEPNLEADRRD